jgi:phage baseplate assembly protein W
MNQEFLSFLGTGWSFPPEFNNITGTVELVSNVDDINQSLQILLSTSLGERVMQPKYGCNMTEYIFEPLSSTMIGYLKERVTNSIMFYEPRIIAENIDVTGEDSTDLFEGRFTISVEYSIPGVNSRFNFVYDYYLNEALRQV